MTSRITLVLLLSLLLSGASAKKSTGFVYNGDMTCSNSVEISVDSLDCGNSDGLCYLGDNVDASGSLTITSDIPEDAILDVQICILNVACKSVTEKVDFCDALGLQGSDGQECPAAGTYSYSGSFKLPGDSNYYMSGYSVSLKASVSDESGNSYFTCKGSAQAKTGYTMTWAGAFIGVAALVSVGSAAFIHRKRRVAKIDLLSEEQTGANFEMMAPGVTV